MKEDELKRIEEISKGNIKEFEVLFREFYRPLLLYANKILRKEAEAEEIVQDLFFNIWRNREKLNINVSVSSYLYSAIRNNCLQHIKRQKIKTRYQDYLRSQPVNIIQPIESLEYQELHQKINTVMDELPNRCQEIFKLSRFQGLKYQEIADQLSISIKTVEANVTKALKHFRKNLKEYTLST